MSLKRFVFFINCYGGYFVKRSKTFWTILVEGILRNISTVPLFEVKKKATISNRYNHVSQLTLSSKVENLNKVSVKNIEN